MSWEPQPRPEWVRAVNDGAVVPIAEEAALPFSRDQLLGEAVARLGLPHRNLACFGDDAFLEPLDILCSALEDEAELNVLGRWLMRRFILRLLEGRAQLTAYVKADPGVRDEAIGSPVFVTGAPRSGTTILHELLAQDRDHRVPEGWELLRPVPPPDPDPAAFAADPRIPLADRELRMPQVVASGLLAIHEYGGRMPKECLSAMSFEFRSEEFVSRCHVPTYDAWLDRCDMRPAYEMHRLVLRVLQRRFDRVRWVLKSPVHLHALPALLEVYPDARLVVTHRDPLVVLGSVTSLIATLRWAHSDRVDFAEIGRRQTRLLHADLDRLVTHGEQGVLDAGRAHHGHYAEFVNKPMGTMEKVYAHLRRPLEPDTAERMRVHLAQRPQGRHGGHHYSFDDLGLDRNAERRRFARYQEYFDVPAEERSR